MADDFIDDLVEDPDAGVQAAEQPLTDAQIEEAYVKSSFRVLYQSNNYFLPQIKDLITGEKIIRLRPEYQRRLRWSNAQKSLLIESLLLNVPIPPVFLYENDLARYEVMDGQQRLSSIHEYLSNDFPLTGLESLKMLQGMRYNNLPPRLKRGLDRASVSAIVLLHETQTDDADPSLVRRYVFQRLNTGGKALNPQEIRNSLYAGRFNDLIVILTRNNDFCDAFNIPRYVESAIEASYENAERKANRLYRTMGDCQLVLRFFAFLNDANIKGSVRSMLDGTMERYSKSNQEELEELSAAFVAVIHAAVRIFGQDVFTLPPDARNTRRLSVALYDAVVGALFRRLGKIDQYIDVAQEISFELDRVCTLDPELMTARANTAPSIKERISAVLQILDALVP